jgi:hypothetical protein
MLQQALVNQTGQVHIIDFSSTVSATSYKHLMIDTHQSENMKASYKKSTEISCRLR